jgi:hypothetical protein
MGGKTTTTTNEPWAPAKGALTSTLADAGRLYGQGIGGSIWTGPTNAPLSLQQQRGLEMQSDVSRGMDNWMNMGRYNLDAIRNAAPSHSERNLADVASGKLLSGGDPYFEDVLNTSGRKAMDAVNLQAGQMGRSGSTANMDAVARTIGELQTGARSSQYNQERANQMSANGLLDAQRNTGLDRQLGAFDRMGTAFNYATMPGELMKSVGSEYQNQAQNVLNDQIRMFDAAQSAPWEQLGRYNAIAQGMGGLGSTQTQRESGFGLGDLLGLLRL